MDCTITMDYLSKFNDTFQELIADLAKVFPDDNDFKLYEIAIHAALLANERIVYETFRDKVSDDYKARILERDESFFLNTDYSDVSELDQTDLSIITKLKGLWKKLEASDKDAVWKYLRVLVHLQKKLG